jgi:enolase
MAGRGVHTSRENRWAAVVSHCSCETEDATIADVVAAAETAQIKTDAPSPTERVGKPKRLLLVEAEIPCGRALRGPGRPRTVRRVDCMTVS